MWIHCGVVGLFISTKLGSRNRPGFPDPDLKAFSSTWLESVRSKPFAVAFRRFSPFYVFTNMDIIDINAPPHGRLKNRLRQEAKRLGVNEDKLLALTKAGIIPGTCLGQRSWIYDPEEVDAALKAQREKLNTQREEPDER